MAEEQLEFDFMSEFRKNTNKHNYTKELVYEDIIRMSNDKYGFCPYLRSPRIDTEKNVSGLCAIAKDTSGHLFGLCNGIPYQNIEGTNFAIFNCDKIRKLYDKDKQV